MKEKRLNTARMMWELIKYKPGLYAANFAVFFAIFLIPVLPGLVYNDYYTRLESRDISAESVLLTIAILAGIYLIRALLLYIGAYTDSTHRFYVCNLVRYNLISYILARPGACPYTGSAGSITNSIKEDANQIEESITWTIDIIGTYTFAMLAGIILLSINWKITLIAFAPFFVLLFLVKKTKTYIERNRKKVRETSAQMSATMTDIFSAMQSVKAFGSETEVTEYMYRANKERCSYIIKDHIFTRVLSAMNNNVIHITTGLILLIASAYMYQGTFSIGNLVLFLYYLDYISGFVMEFGEYLAHYKQTEIAFQRLEEYFEPEDRWKLVEHTELDLKNVEFEEALVEAEEFHSVEYRSIGVSYGTGEFKLRGFSLKMSRGEKAAIRGKVGSGKSSLLKALVGLLPVTGGEIFWNGVKVEQISEYLKPAYIGYIPQSPKLMLDTIKNNILLGLKADGEDLACALKKAILEEDISLMSDGLETDVGAGGGKLSGGQQKRVAAARALVRKPVLLGIDDISNSLDRETESKFWEKILADKDLTCLIVTNNEELIGRCDKVIDLS